MTDHSDPSDVAVVGLAARFPDATTPAEFWANIRNGHESVRTLSDDELREAGVPEDLLGDPNYVKAATPLAGFADFDAEFFGLGPSDAAIMDPQHRVMLEVAWECLESSGHLPQSFQGDIGVFAGCGMNSYFMFNVLSNPDLVKRVGLFLLRHTGNDKDFLATRISYALDLTGPSISVQTACSTSLVAIHEAANALLQGECDMALAGGVTIEIPHQTGYLHFEGEPLSPDGHCRAFDHRSQGTTFGSGAGMVALRRLADALADGDTIHAVIKGSGVNNDGSAKVSYLAPSVDGQATAIAIALAVAEIDPATISYVEAHGTGTPMGDPIEVAALNAAFGPCNGPGTIGIGSVKPNIGHLDTAAGIAGFIKLVEAIRHREIPPSINVEVPNPLVDWAGGPFMVNRTLRAWPDTGATPARGAVSSLGVGGTNAHIIVEEAPKLERARLPSRRRSQLVTISGRTADALEANSARLATFLEDVDGGPIDSDQANAAFADTAYSLQRTRHGFATRRSLVAADRADAAALLRSPKSASVATRQIFHDRATLCYLFPGGASQYPNMGRDLYDREPVYGDAIDAGLARLADLHGIHLLPGLYPDAASEEQAPKLLAQTDHQLPAIFMTEYALAKLYESWGFKPRAMAGHSLGQMTAACLAGVFSFEDGLDLTVLRGQLVDSCEEGGVLSVGLASSAVEPFLFGRLVVAGINAPELTVVSGTGQEIRELTSILRDAEVEVREIPLNSAAHSPLFDPILIDYENRLRDVALHGPTLPVACNLTGGWLTDENATDPRYWAQHFRQPVRFADNIELLLANEGTVLVEVGPGKALSSFARSARSVVPHQPVLASMRHPDQRIDDNDHLLDTIGRMWTAGIDLDVDRFYGDEQRHRVELPTYAFQRQRYFIEPRQALTGGASADATLRREPDIADWFSQSVWHERPFIRHDEPTPESRWLIFKDSTGVGDRLAERLLSEGHHVVSVTEGDGFAKLAATTYVMAPESGRAGYDDLASGLAESGFVPDRVLHMWSLTDSGKVRPGTSWYHHLHERGFLSLVHLAQVMGDHLPDAQQQWTIVTNGAHAVSGTSQHPEKATLLGAASVIPHEYRGIKVSVIDIELPQPVSARAAALSAIGTRLVNRAQATPASEDIVDDLRSELAGGDPNSHVGYRNGHRFVRSYDRVTVSPGDSSRLRQGGTYMITGGFGGLGLYMAERLGRVWGANLVLVGRTPLPQRSAWDGWITANGPTDPLSRRIRKLLALENAGIEFMAATADVADVSQMEQVVVSAVARFGRIDGVLHAAGVVEENLIALKSEFEMDSVFNAKVHGAMVLDRVFESHAPDFIAYFSSTSTALGIPGQIDYAAANAFLDARAQQHHAGKPEILSLAWGPWREVGRAADRHAAASDGEFVPNAHPLIDFIALDPGRVIATTELDAAATWVLDEHRSEAGTALLPGSAQLELLVSTALATGLEHVEVENLSFMTPLVVPDGEVRDARVVMDTTTGGLSARIQTANHGSSTWETHSEAALRETTVPRPPPVDLAATAQRCTRSTDRDECGVVTRQEAHIRFGPRWRCIHSIMWGDDEALAELALPPDYAPEVSRLNLHPALLDMATGYGLPLVDGYDELGDVPLYVPMSYGRLRWFAPLGDHVFSHLRLREVSNGAALVRFDVTLTDTAGNVSAEIEDFALVKVADSAAFGEQTRPAGALRTVGDVASPEDLFRRFLDAGIEPDEGWAAFELILESTEFEHLFVSPLPLQGQIDRIDSSLARADDGERFARPSLVSDFRGPETDLERGLVELWEELLGISPIGVDDDFFELGGHSLIALRLFSAIRQRFGIDRTMSALFDAPTIAGLAALVHDESRTAGQDTAGEIARAPDDAEMNHVVAMQRHDVAGAGRPFFVVAGMFGNILNLRHIAMLIGADRPVYGIQAKGLRGDEDPHDNFEDMATAYIAEIRRVQAHGPYLLGGFSGGGMVAYEMARQLDAVGETAALVAMFDTPVPGLGGQLTKTDKALLHWQRAQTMKHRYPAHWLKAKAAYRRELKRKQAPPDTEAIQTEHDFRTDAIIDAWMHAVDAYVTEPWDGDIHLYRPALNREFKLSGGRYIDRHYNFQVVDGGWGPHVRHAFVTEVPGDHDSMVLEPNVRVLAAALRADLARVEAGLHESRG